MPNWCENKLKVWSNGENDSMEQLAAFFKDAQRGIEGDSTGVAADLSLQSLYPCPLPLLNTESPCNDEDKQKMNVEQFGYADWYEWCIANWGTKWDVDGHLIESQSQLDEGYLAYEFDSAWAPPIQWLEYVSALYPLLKFQLHYDESGMCFKGVANAKNGEVKNQSISYSEDY